MFSRNQVKQNYQILSGEKSIAAHLFNFIDILSS